VTAVPPPFDPASLGVDLNIGIFDVPGVWGLASGFQNLGNAHVRRLTMPPGSLFYDQNFKSFDVLGLVNQDLAPVDIAKAQAAIAAALQDDERVDHADVTVTQNKALQTVKIEIEETLVNGQAFAFILQASSATVALLEINGVSVQAAATGTPAAAGVQLVVGPPGADGSPGKPGIDGTPGTPQWTGGPLGGQVDGGDSSGTESVVDQFWVNFDLIPLTITVQLVASCYALGGATGTYRIRIGGTKNNADGTLAGTPATASSSTPTQKSVTATIANPTGIKFVTVTAQTDTPGQLAGISSDRAITIR
jgi:hypothetical protein